MTKADDRLRLILAQRDAPAEDDAFVSGVMARAAWTPAPRTEALPALLRPFAWSACLVALGAVAPFLVEGLRGVVGASDPRVLAGSLALALSAWFVLDGFRRGSRPLLAR